jgi:tRNA (adenine57-N1/adenine58-N1)-methyltransferase
MEGLARRPQTIGPKDAASILFHAGISPDDVVIEAGAGSGWLTIALAAAVGPRGRVIAYEKREDFAMFARENVERTGMGAGVEIRVGDVVAEMREQEVAAVVLDLPEPWTVVSAAWKALRIGGTFASFSPTVEQVRRTVEALAGQPFADVRTIEVIEREMVVRGTGTRPSSAPVGHTGYLTFARKVLETL